jgi:hypothetical protein
VRSAGGAGHEAGLVVVRLRSGEEGQRDYVLVYQRRGWDEFMHCAADCTTLRPGR